VEQQRKNAKLIEALKQANTTVEGDLSAKEIIINDMSRSLEEKLAEIANVHEQLQAAKDKITKLEQETAAQQRHGPLSTPTRESLWGRNGDSFNILPISSTPSFVPTPINSFIDDDWELVGKSIKLKIAPWRSLSSEDGDLSRASLGANGYLIFEVNTANVTDIDVRTGAIRSREPGTVRRVNYYNTNHDLMFRAELPKKKLLKDIQGNAEDFMFTWDVVNQVHGFHRRYVFAFPSKPLLSVALYRIFYDNQQLMEEFFDVNNGRNRFYAKEANVPAH
jgi:hypothetical protein